MGPLFRAATALGPEAAAQCSVSRAHMGELLQWLVPEAKANPEMEGPLVSFNSCSACAHELCDTFHSERKAWGQDQLEGREFLPA